MIIYSPNNYFYPFVEDVLPLPKSPLVQCITNVITVESVANAVLYINAKPVMADEIPEFPEFMKQSDSLFLNLGHRFYGEQNVILEAAKMAQKTKTPFVVDLVGVAAAKGRNELAHDLMEYHPTVVKGNISEMRTFCGLKSGARGVDALAEDQSNNALHALINAMKEVVEKHPDVILLATGKKDLIVSKKHSVFLKNGTTQLDRFTGTGDIVGAMITSIIGAGVDPIKATITAVSYLNLCAEKAMKNTLGLADFRQETLNQLSLLMNETEWYLNVRGGSI
ncbi:hydroxyethylthiazole kinase [Companilactobacillus furfuricola]|uniref:hydroxyethylthiazole kinase n=1 Tax=Companilactobacillus furfuricola TaxID=1462575 RepID=UPI000F768BB3|nr:hydroxyethylthiazole kinase [Companilactobacillus furfuricola]